MNRKKLAGIIVAGVVVVACVVGGIYAYNKNKVTDQSAFAHLINTDYSLTLNTTKGDNGYDYELNVEGKLTPQDIEHIAKQAKAVANNSDQIIVNQLKEGTEDNSFTGFFSKDLENKAIVQKDGAGKLISFKTIENKDGKQDDKKVSHVSAYSTNGSEKLDSVDVLKITLADDKDIISQGNAIDKAIENQNATNDKVKTMVIDFSNSDNTKGVIIDNSNPDIEADYSSFNA